MSVLSGSTPAIRSMSSGLQAYRAQAMASDSWCTTQRQIEHVSAAVAFLPALHCPKSRASTSRQAAAAVKKRVAPNSGAAIVLRQRLFTAGRSLVASGDAVSFESDRVRQGRNCSSVYQSGRSARGDVGVRWRLWQRRCTVERDALCAQLERVRRFRGIEIGEKGAPRAELSGRLHTKRPHPCFQKRAHPQQRERL
eukprot:365306-Chlamydomonas_euryale.AAC.8